MTQRMLTQRMLVSLAHPDDEAGNVVFAWVVHARHLGGLPAQQRASGLPAGLCHARDEADFRDAAGVAQVRLQDGGCFLL